MIPAGLACGFLADFGSAVPDARRRRGGEYGLVDIGKPASNRTEISTALVEDTILVKGMIVTVGGRVRAGQPGSSKQN